MRAENNQFFRLQALVLEIISELSFFKDLAVADAQILLPDSAMNFTYCGTRKEKPPLFIKIAPFMNGVVYSMNLFAELGVSGFREKFLQWIQSASAATRRSPEATSYELMSLLQLPTAPIVAATDWYFIREFIPARPFPELIKGSSSCQETSSVYSSILTSLSSQISRLHQCAAEESDFPEFSVEVSDDRSLCLKDPYASHPHIVPFNENDGPLLECILRTKPVIIHGDLKPTNILISEKNIPFVIDGMLRVGVRQLDTGKFLARLACQSSIDETLFESIASQFWHSYCGHCTAEALKIGKDELLRGSFYFGMANLFSVLQHIPARYGELIGSEFEQVTARRHEVEKFFAGRQAIPDSFRDFYRTIRGSCC